MRRKNLAKRVFILIFGVLAFCSVSCPESQAAALTEKEVMLFVDAFIKGQFEQALAIVKPDTVIKKNCATQYKNELPALIKERVQECYNNAHSSDLNWIESRYSKSFNLVDSYAFLGVKKRSEFERRTVGAAKQYEYNDYYVRLIFNKTATFPSDRTPMTESLLVISQEAKNPYTFSNIRETGFKERH